MTLNTYRAPANLLNALGIKEPQEINIEAIAQHCGATIVYESLEGCEARIIGFAERAIITVNQSSQRGRQRFSGAHELGHWIWDRGKAAFACTEVSLFAEWGKENQEQRANRYAADLLLPEFMFRPKAFRRDITFCTVEELGEQFQTSLTATAIRLVEFGSFPAIVVCTEDGKRRWFVRGPGIPERLWPLESPRAGTIASDLHKRKRWDKGPVEVYADQWFSYPGASRHGLTEDSIRITSELVLSLLWWKDERPLVEMDEWRDG